MMSTSPAVPPPAPVGTNDDDPVDMIGYDDEFIQFEMPKSQFRPQVSRLLYTESLIPDDLIPDCLILYNFFYIFFNRYLFVTYYSHRVNLCIFVSILHLYAL